MSGLYGLSLFTTLASRKSLQAILATGSAGHTDSRERTGAHSIHLTKLGQGTGRVPTQIEVHTVIERAVEDEEESWSGREKGTKEGPRAHFV